MATRIHFAETRPAATVNLAGSLVLHGFFFLCIVAFGYVHHAFGHAWGSSSQSTGAIQANLVSAIPLPSNAPPSDNVLATENPNPNPAPPKPAAIAKPQPDEIAITGKLKPLRDRNAPQPPPHPQPVAPSNRIPGGEAPGLRIAVSTLQLSTGTSSMSVPAGDFGSRFAWYVNGINRTVSLQWWTQEADPRTSNGRAVTLLFDVLRDGAPTNVRVERSSNSPSLDASAIHALQRVDGFGPLPDTYRGDRITVEYTFDYRLR
jgi:protein TonB